MKKTLALVLIFMFIGAVAVADYDKDIQFYGYDFGTTFGEISQKEQISYMYWDYMIKPSFETASNVLDGWYKRPVTRYPHSFKATFASYQTTVAGHDAEITMYFTYPISEGRPVLDLSSATLYAGLYSFEMWDEDSAPTFDEMLRKLTSIYGEPSLQTQDLEEVWTVTNSYVSIRELFSETEFNIAVWQSSTNGVKIILNEYIRWGDDRNLEISYLYPAYDEAILALDTSARKDVQGVDGHL